MADRFASPRMADPVLTVDHVTMRFGGLVAVNDLSDPPEQPLLNRGGGERHSRCECPRLHRCLPPTVAGPQFQVLGRLSLFGTSTLP